jgi:type IV pilus assembly protein PilC
MPQYNYVAVNRSGEKIKGTMVAPNEAEVRVALRSQQLRPLKILQPNLFEFDLAKILELGGSTTPADLGLFTKQLSILITSGIPLIQGIEIIEGQLQNPAMKRVLGSLREKISSGAFLWETMKSYPKTFPDLYVSMVRAGEASGALDTILKRLIKYLDDAEKLKKLVKGAMIYPIAIVLVGFAVIMVMLTYVIPKFEALLSSNGQELPEVTQFVINASHFAQKNFITIIGGAVLTGYLFKRYISTKEGRAVFDHYVLKVPLFGPIILKVSVARFSRTLQTLLSSGINLLDAIDICKEGVGNESIANQLDKIKKEVEQGKTLSATMSKSPVFPSMVIQMITVGESTGNLDKMLERIADFYEEEVQNLVGNLTKLIEPFVLVFLGGIVGGIMIAMYLPIFKMAGGA